MSLRSLHLLGSPVLRQRSAEVGAVDEGVLRLVDDMFETMDAARGVGLAANQVDLPYRVFIANPEGDPKAKDAECVFINPVLLKGAGQHEREEGCLSIPGVYGNVTRKQSVSIQAYNLAGEEISGEIDGLLARVFQHELDHLDGRLFIDRITPTQLADISGELEEFEIDFNSKRAVGEMPSDEAVVARIEELERLRT